MQGFCFTAVILVIPCLLGRTTAQAQTTKAGTFVIKKVYRVIRKDRVDFFVDFFPKQPAPTVEPTMTLNYWATNRTKISTPGVFVEPRSSHIKGLLQNDFTSKGLAKVSFNKTDFLDFVNGYMGLPYQPIIKIGFPDHCYFFLRFRVDFEWKVDEKINVILKTNSISFPRGEHLYFNITKKDPKNARNNVMEFLIPEVFEETADFINFSRIHISLFFIDPCHEITSAYFGVRYKNLPIFFEGSRRISDRGWGKMIIFYDDYEFITVNKDHTTNVSLPIENSCDGDTSDDYFFPQGYVSLRRRAVFSKRSHIIDELSSKVVLKFGYRGHPYGFFSDYGSIWEETTDKDGIKDCRYFGDSCVITCKFVGAKIANVSIGKVVGEDMEELHLETPRTFERTKMSIRFGLGKNRVNESYYCQMYYGSPKPINETQIDFTVIF